MSSSDMHMIAGLGNPGGKYAGTRHNIGFMAADALAARKGCAFGKSRFNAAYVKTAFEHKPIFIVKPGSFMNMSGGPIQRFASYYRIDAHRIVVIHDDMDLLFGRIKIVSGRGHGGHNGVRSIMDALGTRAFSRVRVGVGRPAGEKAATGHVLGEFSKQEKRDLEDLVTRAADAALSIVHDGVDTAMGRYNCRPEKDA